MLAEWESREQVNLPPEASDLWLSPVTGKYSSEDEVSTFMNSAFDAIKNLGWTEDQVLTAIQKDTLGLPVPQAVKNNAAQYYADIADFTKKVKQQSDAKLKFEITNAQNGVTTAPAPTLEQARFKFYKNLGVPEMALLPDVSAKYQFDPSMFGDKDRASRLDKLIGEQQGLVDKGAAGAAYTQKQADVYTAKGNAAAARAAGDKARQEYLDANAKPDQITQVLDWFSRNGQGILGKAFGKDKTSERKNLATKAGEEAMKRELARLSRVAPVSAETSRYGDAKRSLDIYRNIQLEDDAYNQRVADLVSQKLAAQGRTPNQDAINQLLGYAATVNKKK